MPGRREGRLMRYWEWGENAETSAYYRFGFLLRRPTRAEVFTEAMAWCTDQFGPETPMNFRDLPYPSRRIGRWFHTTEYVVFFKVEDAFAFKMRWS